MKPKYLFALLLRRHRIPIAVNNAELLFIPFLLKETFVVNRTLSQNNPFCQLLLKNIRGRIDNSEFAYSDSQK